jgi:hypothetical protein
MKNWLKYSGASIIFSLNPLHWRYIPWIRDEKTNEWPDERVWAHAVTWLFLTIRVWVDDGRW